MIGSVFGQPNVTRKVNTLLKPLLSCNSIFIISVVSFATNEVWLAILVSALYVSKGELVETFSLVIVAF